jgi:signal transduction histidine kinase/DNA-binding response OmpR family regulator
MKTALVVDDHPEGIYLLRCLLAADGFSVLEAHNGREALSIAETQNVDVVISDILMPVMDGFSLCRAWRADLRLRAIPFIVYTATYVDKRDEDLALSLGADLFLVKPTEPTVLMARVREVIARRSEHPASQGQPSIEEAPFLQQYSQVLVHKLEDKLTELEKANQALRLKDFALASSSSGILFTGPGGEVSYANPAILRMLDKAADAVLGEPVNALFALHLPFEEWFASRDPQGSPEMQLAAPVDAPRPIWVRVEKHTITNEDHTPLGTMLSCADVTEERRLRQELARVQRLESLSLFAAGVAHDFNNLLMGIFAGLDLDPQIVLTDKDREAHRALARAAFDRARDLTQRLLTFAKRGTAARKATDLRQLLDDSMLLALSGSSIRCDKRYSRTPAIALVDPGQMAQVLSNLLVNARQALNDQGVITVSVAVEDGPSESADRPARVVRMTVADNGPGISPDIIEQIFEPYFTTKKDGSGLGLATSNAIVTEHGGRISVRSRPGKGAIFEVVIPAADSQVAPAPAITGPIQSGSGRILVMDDEIAIRTLLDRGLSKVGYSVVVVSNGDQAVKEFTRARNEGAPFQLAILDLTVRGGVGGAEALARLRNFDPNLLAIAITGYADEELLPGLHSSGFARMLAKPFMLHELCSTIKAILPSPNAS